MHLNKSIHNDILNKLVSFENRSRGEYTAQDGYTFRCITSLLLFSTFKNIIIIEFLFSLHTTRALTAPQIARVFFFTNFRYYAINKSTGVYWHYRREAVIIPNPSSPVSPPVHFFTKLNQKYVARFHSHATTLARENGTPTTSSLFIFSKSF